MVFTRKRKSPAKPRWGKRKVRRTMNISRPSRALRMPSNALNVKRRVFAGSVTTGTVSTGRFWSYVTTSLTSAGTLFTTALGGLTNMTEYDALFDTYALKGVKFEFQPKLVDISQPQTYDSVSPAVLDRGYIDVIIDPKSNTVPSGTLTGATYNAFAEIGNPKTYRADKPFSVYFKPLIQEQYGGGFNRYITPRPTDITATAMQHRGFHIFWRNQNMSSVTNVSFDVYVTYYLQFRGKR